MAKEKINHSIAMMSYTDFASLYYYMYKIKNYDFENGKSTEKVYPPVHFYDEINKKLLDDHFNLMYKNESDEWKKEYRQNIEQMISDASKTVWHGFQYVKIKEWLRDAGTAESIRKDLTSKFKKIETLQNFADFAVKNEIEATMTVFKKTVFLLGE